MKNHNTSLLIILFNSYDWSLYRYSTIIRKISFFVIAPVIRDYLPLFFDKYPFKMHYCFISLTFISIHYQR